MVAAAAAACTVPKISTFSALHNSNADDRVRKRVRGISLLLPTLMMVSIEKAGVHLV